jgi:hypothetical protein
VPELRKGAVELTLSAIAAVIIALLVLFVVVWNVFPEIRMAMNSGKEIKGKQYFQIQEQVKLCQAWLQSDYLDTINYGVDSGFSDLGLNKAGYENPLCVKQATDYQNCVKKCVALLEISSACGKKANNCYAIDEAFQARCDLEGCLLAP